MWGCVCEELNVKDAYFHVRNDSFFEFMATVAVFSAAVCCASAYMNQADSRGGFFVLEMTVGCRSSSEGYRAENLRPIPPLWQNHASKLLCCVVHIT